ncbi:hypothetical protein D3Z62_16330 [Lachnospiraceae bacterium]|jgi:hypothetical protein|nr:hypothetical protein [Lachnospiraceae bacterium]
MNDIQAEKIKPSVPQYAPSHFMMSFCRIGNICREDVHKSWRSGRLLLRLELLGTDDGDAASNRF